MNISFKGRELFTFDWPANNRTHSHISAHRSAQIMTRKMCYVLNLFGDFTRIEQGSWINTKQPKKKTKSCSNGKQWANMKKVDACCAVRYTAQLTFCFLFSPKGGAEFSEWQNKNCVHRLKNCVHQKVWAKKTKKKKRFFFVCNGK